MKKLFFLTTALALVFGMSQCKKVRPDMPHYSGPVGDMYVQHVTVNASHGSSNSKVTGSQIGTELKLRWQTGDKLHVYNQTHPEMGTEPLTLKGEDGSNEGQFEGNISGATGDNLTFYYKGSSAVVECNEGAVTYAASNFLGQDGILDGDNGIFKRMFIMKKDVAFPLGSSTLELYVPYAILYLDLSAFGTASPGSTVTIAANGSTVASVTGVLTSSKAVYVALPTDNLYDAADPTEVTYTFTNDSKKSVAMKWKIQQNHFYTKKNSSTGEAIVVADTPKPLPSSWTNGMNPYEFTVGVNMWGIPMTKVHFSQGNLQWSATGGGSSSTTHAVVGGTADGTWRFAEHQMDIIGVANSNISSTNTGWIDLFGWGTSGYNSKYPYMTSINNVDYGTGVINIAGTNYDWGVYNDISNDGSLGTNAWRTLTCAEWNCLFTMRQNAANLYGEGNVGGTPGVIILPDSWDWNATELAGMRKPTGEGDLKFTVGKSDWLNTYSYSDWSKMESLGAVFLPASGYRHEASVGSVGEAGGYWSSSYNNNDVAYILNFYTNFVDPLYEMHKKYGYSVRLVR